MMQRIYSHAYLLQMLTTISASAQAQSQKLSVFIGANNYSGSTVTLAWENYDKSTTTPSRKKINKINWTVLTNNFSGSTYADSTIEPVGRESILRQHNSIETTDREVTPYISKSINTPMS
jgi:hypothetical protein